MCNYFLIYSFLLYSFSHDINSTEYKKQKNIKYKKTTPRLTFNFNLTNFEIMKSAISLTTTYRKGYLVNGKTLYEIDSYIGSYENDFL